MNINRQRPPKGCEDLTGWLSGVVMDAIRDAREAGLGEDTVADLMQRIADQQQINGRRRVDAEDVKRSGATWLHVEQWAMKTPNPRRETGGWLLELESFDQSLTDRPREIARFINLVARKSNENAPSILDKIAVTDVTWPSGETR